MKKCISQPIGIFDSGVGGLGIMRAISKLLPNENIIYVADNKNLPFGQKTVEQLNYITEKIVSFLINQHNAKIIVIACNTATVASIDYLRSQFSVPIVGVVPVVKPACEQTKTKSVAILSTPLTANSSYIKELINKFGQGVKVFSIPCPGLADMVDAGLINTTEIDNYLQKIFLSLREQNIDMVGLCCTQYAFLRNQMQNIAGSAVTILDSNIPVACQTKRVLEKISNISNNIINSENCSPEYNCYVTKEANEFKSVAQNLVDSNLVSNVQLIVL